jgi:formylglycine-generating enzyme required for sulfatase activity
VDWVSWQDAVQFCNKLSVREGQPPAYRISDGGVTWNAKSKGYRLPTEAEWEYACRAGTTTAYHAGESESDLALAGWFSGVAENETHPVGKKTPNAWGLYDMHGNAWEWCWDLYGDYGSGTQMDPEFSTSDAPRIFRGGCWFNDAGGYWSALRNKAAPSYTGNCLGFRVVRSSPQ